MALPVKVAVMVRSENWMSAQFLKDQGIFHLAKCYQIGRLSTSRCNDYLGQCGEFIPVSGPGPVSKPLGCKLIIARNRIIVGIKQVFHVVPDKAVFTPDFGLSWKFNGAVKQKQKQESRIT